MHKSVALFYTFAFLLVYLSSSAWASSQVQVDFDYAHGTSTNKRMFGTLDPDLLNTNSILDPFLAEMDVGFVRLVDQDSTLRWMNYTSKNWSATAVLDYYNNVVQAYAAKGRQLPEFIIDIKRWPTWMYNGSSSSPLPYELYANYSQMCADLVTLVNKELELNVTYWQPWANIDTSFTKNRTALFELYNMSAAAMKAADPTIKVGPGISVVNTTLMNDLIKFSPYVDFANAHFYYATSIFIKSTDDIFYNSPEQPKLKSYLDDLPKVRILVDEYALHFNSSAPSPDPRILNNINAAWIATMHVNFANFGEDRIEGAIYYNLNSDFIGLTGKNNVYRPSSYVMKWSNSYFIGDVYSSQAQSTNLTTLAVRTIANISAVYIINIGATNIDFTFSGWDKGFILNTINSTKPYYFENETTYEWTTGINGLHTIPSYTVWCLYYDPAAPPIFINSTSQPFIVLSIVLSLDEASFNETLFIITVAQALNLSTSAVSLTHPTPPSTSSTSSSTSSTTSSTTSNNSTSNSSSSSSTSSTTSSSSARSFSFTLREASQMTVEFKITSDDATISQVSSQLDKITDALQNAGFAPNTSSISVVTVNHPSTTSTTGPTSNPTSTPTDSGTTGPVTGSSTTDGSGSSSTTGSLPTTTSATPSPTSSTSTTGDLVQVTGKQCGINNVTLCYTDPTTPHPYSTGLAAGLGVVIGIGALVAIFAGITLVIYWAAFRKKFGNFYCSVIIFGVFMGYVSAITLLPRPTDALCIAFPWFLGIGFTLVYGCLFIKTFILYRIWQHAMQLKRPQITAMTVVKYCGVAVALEIIFLIIWTTVDPPKVHLVKLDDNTTQNHCSKTNVFWIIFVVVKGLWLFFGAAISVMTRHIRKDYNEFKGVANCIFSSFILLVIAIPLVALMEKLPNGVMIIEVLIIVLAFTFTIIFLFFSTWQSVLFPNMDKFDFPQSSSTVSMNPVSHSPTHSPTHSQSSITITYSSQHSN
eukprot:Phypoly_transcript_01642.p1 GENE.Phypoly_transcript_01642~~Phypoly_transcript_01642.p1  ORF type:complete len:982 (+),score=148.82 Phypoly_transcript_01642:236-3181(+)